MHMAWHGHRGSGFKLSLAIGACMSGSITEGQARTADIAAFCCTRYAERKPLGGP